VLPQVHLRFGGIPFELYLKPHFLKGLTY
jgi:hypothetical protein